MWGSRSRQLKEAELKSNVIHAGNTRGKHLVRQTVRHDTELRKTEKLNTHKVIRERDTAGENIAQVNTIIYEPKLNTTHTQKTIKINQETNTETETKTQTGNWTWVQNPGSWHLPVFIQDFPEPHQFCPILRQYYILNISLAVRNGLKCTV